MVVESAHLEVMDGQGRGDQVILSGNRFTVGRSQANDLTIESDSKASRLHAVFSRYPAGWCIRDLGSSNGTFVNGERVWAERMLNDSDEVRFGQTLVIFRGRLTQSEDEVTAIGDPAPTLTAREREVLLALCRPALTGEIFTEPASVHDIAQELVVTEAAVKQHLLRLYDKFGIQIPGERRRVRLANAAIRSGAVTAAELHRLDESRRKGRSRG